MSPNLCLNFSLLVLPSYRHSSYSLNISDTEN
uniref:Uncharacterized protein n=1 Tax=Arundo donax TaxID=35708 RepID=A0A0A8Z406_ARUDO